MEDRPSDTTLRVGGIPTTRVSRAGLAKQLVADWQLQRVAAAPPRVVFSSNGAVIADFHRNAAFRQLMLQADIVDADGMPLVIASKLLCERPLIERVATTDFINDAAVAASQYGLKFFFLGGKPGVAESAAAHFTSKYPGLKIVGAEHGYFSSDDEARICRSVVSSGTDVLWVGLGSPLQESFAIRNRARLSGLTWIRTCGGMFDHYCGKIPRAPLWMQKVGLEWLHRALHEPFRLGRRYAATNLFAAYYLITETSDHW